MKIFPTSRRLPLALCLFAVAFAPLPLAAQSGGAFQDIERPATAADSGVFVEQIGNNNSAEVTQQTPDQAAGITQDGDGNTAEIDQRDTGAHFASIAQNGDDNTVLAAQEGAGEAVLLLSQQGGGNDATVLQRDTGGLGSAAAILQSGNDNLLNLVQDGSDNQARLTQNGDGNAMTAIQLNSGNRLEWTQNGTDLPDLEITQTGGAAMQITQTSGGSVGGGSN